MNIKEALSRLRSKIELSGELSDEAAKALSQELSGIVKDIEFGVADLEDSLKTVNSEAKNKKLKIRELEQAKEELESTLEAVKSDTGVEQLKQENETLKQFRERIYKTYKEELKKDLETFGKTEKFQKVEKFLKLKKTEDEKGFDFDSLTEEEIEYNRTKIEEYKELGYFDGKKIDTDGRASGTGEVDFNKKIAEAKSFEELERLQEETE